MPRNDQEALLRAYLRNYERAQAETARKAKVTGNMAVSTGRTAMNSAPLHLPTDNALPAMLSVVANQAEAQKKAAEKEAERQRRAAVAAAKKAAKEQEKAKKEAKEEASGVPGTINWGEEPAENPYAKAEKAEVPKLKPEPEKKSGFWNGIKNFGGALKDNFVQGLKGGALNLINAIDAERAKGYDPDRNLAFKVAGLMGQDFTEADKDKIRAEGDKINRQIVERNEAFAKASQEKNANREGKAAKAGQLLGSGLGGMVPTMAAGIISPVTAAQMTYAQGVGSSYGDALADGATAEQAYKAGIGGGAVTAGIEALTGGIPMAGEGIIPVGELASRYVKSNAGKMIVNRLAEATGEGAEEVLENYVMPFVERATYKEEMDWPTLQENLDSFMSAALASAALGTAVEDIPNLHKASPETVQNEPASAPVQEAETVVEEQAEPIIAPKEQPKPDPLLYPFEAPPLRPDNQPDGLPVLNKDKVLKQEPYVLRKVLSDVMNVPNSKRGELNPMIDSLVENIRQTGEVDPALVEEIYNTARGLGTARQSADSFAQDVKQTLKDLRLDPGSFKNTAEFKDLQSAYGKRNLVGFEQGGVPIDVQYAELNEQFPTLFPLGITHPMDQMAQIYKVADTYSELAKDRTVSFEEELGENAADYYKNAREGYDVMVNRLSKSLADAGLLEQTAMLPKLEQRESTAVDYADPAQMLPYLSSEEWHENPAILPEAADEQWLAEQMEEPSISEPVNELPEGKTGADMGVGAMHTKYPDTPVEDKGVSVRKQMESQLSTEEMERLGDLPIQEHIPETDKEAFDNAKMSIDAAVQAAGNETVALNDRMAELNSKDDDGNTWNKDEYYEAKEIFSRLNQQWRSSPVGSDAEILARERLLSWSNRMHQNNSKAGSDLQARRTSFTPDGTRIKVEKFKQDLGEKWAKKNVQKAKELKGFADDLALPWENENGRSELAEEMKAVRNGLKEPGPDMLAKAEKVVREKAKNHKINLTDTEVKALAADMVLGEKASRYYDRLLQFATDIADVPYDVYLEIDNLLYKAERMPDSRERFNIENEVYQKLADTLQPKASTWDKLRSWRYLSMLYNPTTHDRNIIGNIVMDAVVRGKDAVGAKIEEKFIPQDQRTKAILTNSEADRALRGAAYQYAENGAYKQLAGESRFNVVTGIEGSKRIFKNDFIENRRRVNNAALEGEDFKGVAGLFAAYNNSDSKAGEFARKMIERADKKGAAGKAMLGGLQNNFAHSMAQFLKARGYDANIFNQTDMKSQAILEEATEYAVKQAQQATFHEYSEFAKWLNQMSSKSKAAEVIIEGVMPFKTTPINIAKQGFRYSPAGLAKNISWDLVQLKRGQISATDFIDNLSQGLTGSAISVIGFFLASQGLLRGSSGDDEYALNKAAGKQDFAIDLGEGGTYSVDWLSPAAIPLLAGAELYGYAQNKGYSAGQFLDAITSMGEPLLETTFLSSLNNIVNAIRFSDEDDSFSPVKTIVGQTASNFASQFFPTLGSKAAKTIDPLKRNSYGGGESATAKNFGYFANRIQNKIPGLSMLNEPYIDVWGREQENPGGNLAGRGAYNMLSPGNYAPDTSTPLDSQLMDLYRTTGERRVIPHLAPKKLKDEGAEYTLTPKQYTQFAKRMGEERYDLLSEAYSNPLFQELTSEQQEDIVLQLHDLAKDISAHETVPEYEREDKEYKVWKKNPAAAVPYLITDAYTDAATEKKREETGKENAGLNNAEIYKVIYGADGLTAEQKAISYISKADDDKAEKAYDKFGVDGVNKVLKTREQYRKEFKTTGISSHKNLEALLNSSGYDTSTKRWLFDLLAPKDKKGNKYANPF